MVLETYVDFRLALEVRHDAGEKIHLLLGERGLGRAVSAGRRHFGFGRDGRFYSRRYVSICGPGIPYGDS